MKVEEDFILGMDRVEQDIKEGFDRMQSSHENRQSSNYFYAFDVGYNCLRHKKYSIVRPRPFDWETKKKFAVGSAIHKEYQLALAQKGYSVELPIKKQYDEFGFTVSGRIDAKKYDSLLELKSTAYFQYIKKPYESNVYQIQMYLDMADMEKGNLVYISPLSGDVKVFPVERDGDKIIECLERLEIVKYAIEDKKLPPKYSTSGCSSCLYKPECEKNKDLQVL